MTFNYCNNIFSADTVAKGAMELPRARIRLGESRGSSSIILEYPYVNRRRWRHGKLNKRIRRTQRLSLDWLGRADRASGNYWVR